MDRSWKVPGSAPSLFVAGETPLLHVESQVFEAMLVGWRDQQRSRNLSSDTTIDRLRSVRRFQGFTNDWPWTWRPVDVEEFTSELRSGGRALSTVRAGAGGGPTLRRFCPDCRPTGPISDLTCSRCGDGPLLAGDLAADPTGHLPDPAQEWLTGDGWDLTRVTDPICPGCTTPPRQAVRPRPDRG